VIDDFFATPFSKLLCDELKEKYLQNDDARHCTFSDRKHLLLVRIDDHLTHFFMLRNHREMAI